MTKNYRAEENKFPDTYHFNLRTNYLIIKNRKLANMLIRKLSYHINSEERQQVVYASAGNDNRKFLCCNWGILKRLRLFI